MITLSPDLQLRSVQFLSNMKLILEKKEDAGTITDEELLMLFEVSFIVSHIKIENNLKD